MAKERIHKKTKNTHKKTRSKYDYPEGYNRVRSLDEQAIILREQYQFPLRPLAIVRKIPMEAEGLWVFPLIEDIAFLKSEHSYNYAVDFVLERIKNSRKFKNWSEGTDYGHLRQCDRTLRRWNQLILAQGNRKLTPVVPAQFGRMHRNESVDYVRENVADNEILFGVYQGGVMLLTHPEREQVWEQLHIDCSGDECAPCDNGKFIKSPFYLWDSGGLHYGTDLTSRANKRIGSVSGFFPQD